MSIDPIPHLAPARDLAILDRLRARDKRTTDTVLARVRPAIVRVACAVLRRPASDPVVEDLVQDALVGLVRGWDRTYSPARGDLETFASGVARKLALNARRDHGRRARLLRLERPALAEQARDPGGARALEARVTVTRILGALPARQRRALELVELAGHTQDEAAALLGTTQKAVNSLLGHGRRTLRDAFGPELAA